MREYGSSITTSSQVTIADQSSYPNEHVYVGSDYQEQNIFKGLIDEIVIWGKVLTSTERDTLGIGSDPKLVSPQLIQTHIGTTGSSTTGIDYVSCDDNNIHEITSIIRNNATPDNFSVNVPKIAFSGTFEESSSYPTITIYDLSLIHI